VGGNYNLFSQVVVADANPYNRYEIKIKGRKVILREYISYIKRKYNIIM
jgi:hypothetical protein